MSRFNLSILVCTLSLMVNLAWAENGERIQVDRRGTPDGPALILVPGLMSSPDVWAGTVNRYADGYDLHLVRIAGFAGTPPADPSGGVIEPAASALASYLKKAGIENAVLVGHSIGGQIALLAAREAPRRVTHVVAVDSLPFLAQLYQPGISPVQAADYARRMKAQLTNASREAFLAQQQQSTPILTKTPAFRSTLAEWAAASDQTTAIVAQSEAIASDWRAVPGEIDADLTILLAYDSKMPLSRERLVTLYREQYAAHDHADIRVVEDAFHFVMIDQPDRFHTELDRILETAP